MRLILFSLALCCSFLLAGQQVFTRYYDYGGDDRYQDMAFLSDSLLVAVGTASAEGEPPRGVISLLDTAGRLRRSVSIDYPLRTLATAVARQSDTTFWVGCWRTPTTISDDWVVYLINAQTGTSRGFGWGSPGTDEQIRAMAPSADGGVVVVGNTGDLNIAFISRLDAEGNELYRRGFSVPGNRFTIATAVVVQPNGAVTVAGIADPDDGDGGGQRNYFLLSLDEGGEMNWSKTFTSPDGRDITGGNLKATLLSNGMLAVVSNINHGEDDECAFVSLHQTNGELEQSFLFNILDRGVALQEGPAGDLILCGYSTADGTPGQSWESIIRFSPEDVSGQQGTFIQYANLTQSRYAGIRSRTSDDYYLFGSGRVCPDSPSVDGMIVRLNESLSDTVANCFLNEFPYQPFFNTLVEAEGGNIFEVNEPRFEPELLVEVAPTTDRRYCSKARIVPRPYSQPLCYREPLRLLDVAERLSPPGSILSFTIELGADAGAGEWIEISSVPASVIATGNRTDFLTITATSQQAEADLLAALSSLTYGADGDPPSGERTVFITPVGVCSGGQTKTITLVFAPAMSGFPTIPNDTLLCEGQALALCVDTLAGVTRQWSTGQTTPCLTVDAPGTYTLLQTSVCIADTASVTVSASTEAPLTAESITEVICVGDSLPFDPNLNAGVSGIWTDGYPSPERVFTTAGNYELTRADACGEAITLIDLRVTDCCSLYLPSAFSPDGDGVNDRFRAFPNPRSCGSVTGYQLLVYNRWGGLVYSGTTLTEGWNGTVKEKPADAGYYVYTVSYFNGLRSVALSGEIMLVR